MPAARKWTLEEISTIHEMRANRAPWEQVAARFEGCHRQTVIDFAVRRLGLARDLPPDDKPIVESAPFEDPYRAAYPPGHPCTWGPISGGTPYPMPVFV
jgi:hypothetical protein